MTHSDSEFIELTLPGETLKLPVQLLLSLTTGSLLLGMVAGRILLSSWVSLGEASEEILRGDRLPTLKFPRTISQE